MPPLRPARLDPVFHPRAQITFLRHSIGHAIAAGTGISTSCPSPTPFGLGLGPGLPWADEPSPGNLRFSADKILTCLFVYLYQHSPLCTLQRPSQFAFSAYTMLPYHSHFRVNPKLRYCASAPFHFRRKTPGPVSYYALFQWWLLLSQHPGCLRSFTSFPT